MIRSRVRRTKYRTAWGERTPKVSTKARASMCPSLATRSMIFRYQPISAREASIGKNTT